MAYSYGIKNRYVPTALINKAYGFSSSRSPGMVPNTYMDRPAGLTAEQFRQQFAYEWLGLAGTPEGYTNPPFASGASGRLMPSIQTANGVPARIQRGFIRRSDIEAAKPESKARLYFMYNPEMITRDYVSYLDQSALDPFNTVFQSGNLVAPPSVLDFSFSLFFDRQEEATDPDHPGVFVDYQFFDLVVRNVVPSDPSSTGNTLPDNGVMMVNPREITVVFSQQISVQGRPLNARVSFVKFTHRMVPTRMQIDLTIRATYLGPLRPVGEYTAEEFQAADIIPLGDGLPTTQLTTEEVEFDIAKVLNGGISSNSALGESITQVVNSSSNARRAALQYAIDHTTPTTGGSTGSGTKYSLARRESEMVGGKFDYVDCSSLIVRSYRGIGAGPAMGWGTSGWCQSTHGMMDRVDAKTFPGVVFSWEAAKAFPESLQPGDILIRRGHVGFFVALSPAGGYMLFDASSASSTPQVGLRPKSWSNSNWTHVLRPAPTGWTSQVGTQQTVGGWSVV